MSPIGRIQRTPGVYGDEACVVPIRVADWMLEERCRTTRRNIAYFAEILSEIPDTPLAPDNKRK